jgi:PEP-CTERM motif
VKHTMIAAALLAVSSQATAALSMGDLAFNSFNADEDGFSVVALANIAAGTKIYFQDNEWISGSFNTGEGSMTWTTGAIAAGTVVRFSNTDTTSIATTSGSVTGQIAMSQSNEAVYAFLGTSSTAPITFLTAISADPAVSLAATGLTVGTNSIVIPNGTDFGNYNGARAGQSSFAAYAGLVNNVANWTNTVDGSFATTVPNTTAFTIQPVPEPAEYALMGVGLGLVGLMARRRNAKVAKKAV